jgi:LmbE family N-acetylglucosaminyl deacetylase
MIIFLNPKSEIYFPTTSGDDLALGKTTHLGIGAHQDDIEILAIHGILKAYDDPNLHFTGVTVTDGRGAPRSGPYQGVSDDELWQIRTEEQKKAADIGQYYAQILMNYSSQGVKSADSKAVIEDLKCILIKTSPTVIYTHNLADKHDTHVAVTLSVIQALREINPPLNAIRLLGCEVWRGLDWLPDELKIALNVSPHPNLQQELLTAFESQIAGGKRYDLATIGRRQANATYYQSHKTDQANLMVYAMDLTPLINNPSVNIKDFTSSAIQSLSDDVRDRLNRLRRDSV